MKRHLNSPIRVKCINCKMHIFIWRKIMPTIYPSIFQKYFSAVILRADKSRDNTSLSRPMITIQKNLKFHYLFLLKISLDLSHIVLGADPPDERRSLRQ